MNAVSRKVRISNWWRLQQNFIREYLISITDPDCPSVDEDDNIYLNNFFLTIVETLKESGFSSDDLHQLLEDADSRLREFHDE